MEKFLPQEGSGFDLSESDFDIGVDIEEFLLFDTPSSGDADQSDGVDMPVSEADLAKQFEAFRIPELGTLESALFDDAGERDGEQSGEGGVNDTDSLLRNPVFKVLASNVRNCFYQNVAPKNRSASLRWIMCHVPERHNLFFDDVVKSFGARPAIIRYRTFYEMALRDVDHHQSFDMLAAPLSNMMKTALRYDPLLSKKMGVVEMGEIVWHNPGIKHDDALRLAEQHEIPDPKTIIEVLLAAGRVTQSDSGRLFFTAINPSGMALSRRNNISWSQMLYDD